MQNFLNVYVFVIVKNRNLEIVDIHIAPQFMSEVFTKCPYFSLTLTSVNLYHALIVNVELKYFCSVLNRTLFIKRKKRIVMHGKIGESLSNGTCK